MKYIYKLSSVVLFLIFCTSGFSQVGVNILIPDSSAILHLESTDRGFLLPRLTTSQMNGINNPKEGLVVYNVEDSLVEYWNGSCWLKTYQENCDECDFIMTIDNPTASIDHIVTDSAFANITIQQTNGTSDISIITLATLPPDISVQISNNIIDSVGTATVSVYASIFSTPGTYPIIIQAVCDQTVRFLTFTVTVEPCLYVPIASNQSGVDLQTFGNLPGPGQPVCVIAEVFHNVMIESLVNTDPAMTWGNLDPQSHVGLIHKGAILGRGGDGGTTGDILNLQFGDDGDDGGDALELTCKTTFDLQGHIYGGGGGGAGIGAGIGFSLPIVGDVFIGFGYGGGGGVSSGLGGQAPVVTILIGQVESGGDATSGVLAVPGDGSQLAAGIDLVQLIGTAVGINIPGLYADLTGGLYAGDGGDYGQPGGDSNASLGLDIGISLPFVNITIFNGQFPFNTAVGGAPGLAIKTNNNTMVNLYLPNSLIEGNIAP